MADQNQTTQKRRTGGIGKRMLRLLLQGHVGLYRRTNGKIGGGEHMLILTTTGRKSGKPWSNGLFYFRDGEHFIVIAANAGAPNDPAWWLNLKSNPHTNIQVGSQIIPVVASKAEGEERQRLWSIIAEKYKNFVGYQKRTTRELSVVILTPQA
jgi:deazaflavin-dependent oxidoreductase (nitroreductase family)